MNVISQEPSFYFLVQDSDKYYIDVNCTVRFSGFCITFELSKEEVKQFKKRGECYIKELAEKVSRLSNSYQARQLNKIVEKQVNNTIMEWNNASKP